MTIDEAIKDLEYGTKQLGMEIKSGLWIKGSEPELRCKEGIALNKQHIEWLKELLQRRERCAQYEVEQISNLEQYDMLSREYEILNERYKEAVRLLKVAVEDFSNMNDHIFDCDGMCDTCPIHGNRDTCDKWVHVDEALKLIGKDEADEHK